MRPEQYTAGPVTSARLDEARGLTVRQPWAGLIASGHKPIENRTWPTRWRGLLLIHAAAKPQWGVTVPNSLLLAATGGNCEPLGAIVAVAHLVDCVRYRDLDSDLKCHPTAEGPWCWLLAGVVQLRRPISCQGKLGLWIPGKEVLAELDGELRSALG